MLIVIYSLVLKEKFDLTVNYFLLYTQYQSSVYVKRKFFSTAAVIRNFASEVSHISKLELFLTRMKEQVKDYNIEKGTGIF